MHWVATRIKPPRVLVTVVTVNIVSALLGLATIWPVAFYGKMIEFVAPFWNPATALFFMVVIIGINVSVEYIISVGWFGFPRNRATFLSFVGANFLSFCLAVFGMAVLMG